MSIRHCFCAANHNPIFVFLSFIFLYPNAHALTLVHTRPQISVQKYKKIMTYTNKTQIIAQKILDFYLKWRLFACYNDEMMQKFSLWLNHSFVSSLITSHSTASMSSISFSCSATIVSFHS